MSERVAVRGLMAIAGREVSERVALLGLAGGVAVVPFLAPHIGIGDRPLLGGLLGSVMVFTAAILTGSSVIARDLAEGRLGFFLARPVPWWSIWGGKMLAAIVLTFAAGAIVLVPWALTGDWSLPAGGWWVQILVPGLIALIGGVNVMAIGYRGRSLWFAADFAMTVGLTWLAARTFRGLQKWGVDAGHVDYAAAALWVIALAVTVAGAAQVAGGRADVRRGHRLAAIALWSLVTPAVLAYAGWGAWARSAAPGDLRGILSAWSAPNGSWIVVAGRARWPRPESLSTAFLVDTHTGHFLRLGPAFSPLRPGFSSDANRAVWVSDPLRDQPGLWVADLGTARPTVRSAPLPVPPGSILGFALAPDGTHAAVTQPTLATVFTVGSAQSTVSVPIQSRGLRTIVFDGAGRAHLLNARQDPLSPGVLDILVLDPSTGKASTTGQIATRGNAVETWGPRAQRVAVLHRPDLRPSLTLHDGRTGAEIATLVAVEEAGRIAATFLRDGRLAVVRSSRNTTLSVYSAEGVAAWSVDVAPSYSLADVIQAAPDVVAVQLPFRGFRGESDTVLVDAKDGRVIRRESGLRPASTSWFTRRGQAVPDDGALFVDEGGTLVHLDIATGDRRRVLGAS